MSYANMDGVPTQTAGTSEILASDWNTYVRDNFDSIKFGHLTVADDTAKSALSVAEGTMVYQLDNQKVFVYSGSSWVEISDLDNTGGRSDAANILAPAGVVTALPGSPVDGQVIYYQADASNGVYWQFRYRSGSGSSYKWEFLGGSPLRSIRTASDSASAANATWTDISNSPSVTVPLAGDYIVEHTAGVIMGAGASTLGISLRRGGTDPSGLGEDFTSYGYETTGTGTLVLYNNSRLNNVSASTALAQRYYHNIGTTQTLERHHAVISVIPVRV